MKTYCETVSGEVFDWKKFLDNAIKNGVNKVDHENACNLAVDWVTCACGQQCSIIERDIDGVPNDSELKRLGSNFNYDIDYADYNKAKQTLEQIEQRSIELINEIENKTK